MKSDEIDYKIFGDDIQYIEVELDCGETVIGEAGSMMYMHDGIEYEAKMGDGSTPNQGFFDKILDIGKRVLTRESLFITHYTNRGQEKSHVAFSAPYPGKIIPLDLVKLKGEVTCQKDSFLCAAKGTSINIEFARKLGTGFFGGEGFILQKLQGDGKAFIHACGGICLKKITNETLRVDSGSIVAFTKGIHFDVEMVKGLKSMLFSGEGLFLATLSGTGYVWLQSLPFSRLADRVISASKLSGTGGKGEVHHFSSIIDMLKD
ncbi:MAG: TIGR00266 family protein [Oligoflexia bacterium]|nr:TIGR00266 family protein [Oligoflexia bacterium]MBF0365565.1 TIGR00266 family protein [Oligoflexia bacterium]